MDKEDEFGEAVECKLRQKKYDFSGTVFPEPTSVFVDFEFDKEAKFERAIFANEARFLRTKFKEGVHFFDAQFNGTRTDFSEATFSGEGAFFSRAKFNGEGTSFYGAQFSGDVTTYSYAQLSSSGWTNFSGAKFSGAETSFREAQFSSASTNFSEAKFNSSAWTNFSQAKFDVESTDFSQAKFGGDWTDFSEAQFNGKLTDFSGAEFSVGGTSFFQAQFGTGRIEFVGAQFCREANFKEATFKGQPDFHDTTLRNATFKNTTFQRRADFTRAKFDGTDQRTTDFREATFGGEPYFKEVEFKGYTDFYRANFLDAVKFIGGEKDKDKKKEGKDQKSDGNDPSSVFPLEGHVSFVRAHIEKPELFSFYAIPLRPSWFVGVDARKFDFTDVKWYGMPGGLEGTLDEEIAALERPGVESPHTLLAQACRRLSANAEENHEYPLANEFHYWSLNALRKQGWRSLGLIRTLYWALSGYGVRAGRALGVLLTLAVVFAVLYMIWGPTSLRVSSSVGIWQVLADAGQAVMYSLGVMARLRPEPIPTQMGLFQILVTTEGILGPLQIALLALAVRRKVMR